MNKYVIRPATIADADFIATTIIEAEKSGTDRCGMALYFDIDEKELHNYLIQMLEEEVDGCELSISSFFIATIDDIPVAALGGWLEGENEDNMSSSLLKSNLIGYCLPSEKVAKTRDKIEIVKDIQVEREKGTYQFEYAYVHPDHLGHKLMQKLMLEHFAKAKEIDPNVTKVYSHPFVHNDTIIKVHEQMGFKIVREYKSSNPLTKLYYPSDTLVLMEAEL